ncbi:MAG: CNNM domain-containing protein, partial [Thermodesulfobacteriota bacterium]
MTILILFFLLALSLSFLCSLLEATLLSLGHAHIALMIAQGRSSGKVLERFKEKIDRPLSAILTLNTIANTVGAAVVGAQALVVFGNKYVAVFSGLLTISILVFSEITPKTLGAVYCRQLAPAAAYLILGLILVTYPLVILFEVLSRLLTPKERQAKVTREELEVTTEMGGREGALLDKERRIIKNLLHLDRVMAKDVMTPRSVLFALPKDETVGRVIKAQAPIRFSRIPIYGRDLDDIAGLVHRYRV